MSIVTLPSIFKIRGRKPNEDPEYIEPAQAKNLKRKADPPSPTDEAVRKSKRPKPSDNLVEDKPTDETSADELGDEFLPSPISRRQSLNSPKVNRTQNRGRPRTSLAANGPKGVKAPVVNPNELNAMYSVLGGLTHEMAQIRAELSQMRGLLEVAAQNPLRTEALLGQAVDLLSQLVDKQP